MKTVEYNDTPAKWLIYPSVIFMVIGMFIGVFISINGFLLPDYFAGEYIHFGRLRPVHVGSVAFLWLLSANIGLFFYFIPRLTGVPLFSPRLAYVTIAIWWFSLIVGNFSYPFGTNSGWEYAELPDFVWYIPVKALFFLSWILVCFNLFATIATRKYQKMYVSLWYAMGTMIWTSFTAFVGFYAVYYVSMGIGRVNVNFFYVHNLVGLIFTPMGLATAYYALPKLAKTPIYSHRLSMIGFWAIAFVYSWVGAHHLIHGPISQWLQTVSIVFSLWLFIPVFSVVTNLFATLMPEWRKLSQSAPIRFLILGVLFYLITCIQGPLMSLRNVNEITSKTDWVIGHAHIALYATFTFFAIAGIYQALPQLAGRSIWSEKLMNIHFSLNLWGSIPFIIPLWIGGFFQGILWSRWADGSTYSEFHRHYTEMPFLDTLAEMMPFWSLRTLGGILILIANLLFLINMFNTILLKPKEE